LYSTQTISKMTQNCCICDEKMNGRIHTPVNCPYCSYEACRKCCETYILDQTVAKCMNPSCAKEWSRKFLSEQFPKTFVCGPFKKHREQVLFEKELALLPATQLVIEERKAKKIRLDQITKEIGVLSKQIQELVTIRQRLQTEAFNIDHGTEQVSKTHKTFIRACSVGDCRGFLSTQWKCGLCDTYTCPDCHVVKGKERNGDHVCNADDLATAKLLDADTKCCPKCATGIYKIEGCDQMWCTQCHTAFSWRTGQIETRIHNPHYYEWQRQNGTVIPREQGDIQCGRELNYRFIENIQVKMKEYLGIPIKDKLDGDAVPIFEEISNIVRSVIHLREVQLNRYRVDHVENNLDLRIKYMCNEINKNDFQINIQRKNKKHDKCQEIYDVIQLLMTTITDIMYRIRAQFDIDKNTNVIDMQLNQVTMILRESDAIVEYVNKCLADISKTYNSRLKKISFFRKTDSRTYRHDVII
jgi:hypothetical protein